MEKLKKKENPAYEFASCGCGGAGGVVKRGFRVFQDFTYIDPCKKCGSRGLMIAVETWRRMRQKKYKGKAVSVNGEISPI